ncbi:XTP/dITP diphosphohydrolase [Lachnospiraceae bacterium RM5]|nr:XTP/dITP diphosphohydrolase [Lachnospiraceae bacterium RM5]
MKYNDKIIFATGNQDKMKEIRMILGDLKLPVVSLKEAGIDVDIVEDGKTFEENAIIKAKEIMKLTGCVTLADDSGLEVDYINKEPGIYSARYLGTDTGYDVKNQSIIDRLKDAKGDERSARFVCAIAACLPDGSVLTTEGTIEGVIGYEEKGENGFGYDPILYVPEYGMTTGQMNPEDKNKISHRGKALRLMKEKLENILEIDI